jgi:hypothetical protein
VPLGATTDQLGGGGEAGLTAAELFHLIHHPSLFSCILYSHLFYLCISSIFALILHTTTTIITVWLLLLQVELVVLAIPSIPAPAPVPASALAKDIGCIELVLYCSA